MEVRGQYRMSVVGAGVDDATTTTVRRERRGSMICDRRCMVDRGSTSTLYRYSVVMAAGDGVEIWWF